MEDIKSKKFPLTVDEFNKLYITDGLSASEIARRYNLSSSHVSVWMKRNKITSKNKGTQSANLDTDLIKKDVEAGFSLSKLAFKYGVSDTLISSKLKKLGIKTQPKHGVRFDEPVVKHDNSHSELMKKVWQRPEYIAKSIALHSNPEYIAKIRESNLKYWASASYATEMAKHRADQSGIMSQPHKKVCAILDLLKIDYMVEHVIGPWAFDIFIPSHNLLIEIQGTFFHSRPEQKIRDTQKATYVNNYASGLQLKYIMEHECLADDMVSAKIKSWLGIKEVDHVDYDFKDLGIAFATSKESGDFLYKWHYQKDGRGCGLDLGCYLNRELIALARFGNINRCESANSIGYASSEVLELLRLVVHPKYKKDNLLSWFLSRCRTAIKMERPDVKCLITFADSTYNHTGAIYKADNWHYEWTTEDSYFYKHPDGHVTQKKTLYNWAKKMQETEADYAARIGAVKVHTKGKFKFSKVL